MCVCMCECVITCVLSECFLLLSLSLSLFTQLSSCSSLVDCQSGYYSLSLCVCVCFIFLCCPSLSHVTYCSYAWCVVIFPTEALHFPCRPLFSFHSSFPCSSSRSVLSFLFSIRSCSGFTHRWSERLLHLPFKLRHCLCDSLKRSA